MYYILLFLSSIIIYNNILPLISTIFELFYSCVNFLILKIQEKAIPIQDKINNASNKEEIIESTNAIGFQVPQYDIEDDE